MAMLSGPVTLSKKMVIISAVVLACLLYFFYTITPHKPTSPPRTTISNAISKTARESSYSYKLNMKTIVGGQDSIYTAIEGWKSEKGLKIKGKITDSDIEFYQIGNTNYTKDQVSGKWIKIVDNQLNQEKIFAAELNPLINFTYRELAEVKYDGILKERDNNVWKYTVTPIVDNSYLEILWKDFVYEFCIDPSSGLLTKATLRANSKTNAADKLEIRVLFDYNSKFEIEPPV